ncbi:unnamed protein product, partial [Prorocentrum cordatum]
RPQVLECLAAAHLAAESDTDAQALRELSLDQPLPNGHTPLQLAALHGRTDVLRLLLEFEPRLLPVDPNAFGSQRRTALHYAAGSRKPKSVGELLRHGADPCVAAG